MRIHLEQIVARQKRIFCAQLVLFCLFPMPIVQANELSAEALKVEVPVDAVNAIPEKGSAKDLPGRLITYKDGSIVFRAVGLTKEIPVKTPSGNPFENNIQNTFAKQQSAWELVGTVPVSVKVSKGDTRAVDVQSNVGQVWNQISTGFQNHTIADKFQRYVKDYEANVPNVLSQSSKGWATTMAVATTPETVTAKPDNLAKLQKSIASDIFQLSAAPSANLTQKDFIKAAELFQATDPDQLFGSYGPISINWSLDELRRFARAASSVAAIYYLGEIKGSGFLIGDNLLLTCDHVLDLVDLNTATATFQHPQDGQPPITLNFEGPPLLRSSTLSLTSKISNKKLRCDFALLKLKDSKSLAVAGIRPLEIRKDNVLNAVIAVVGYPQTFKRLTIHDNGTLLFPYLLPKRDFETVYMQRIIHSLNVGAAPAAPDDVVFQARLKAAQTTFQEAYGYHDNDAANTTYYYVGQKEDWKDVPTVGVDTSDTHGDSGGAVFDKTTLRVIGILRGGPQGAFPTGSWFNHDKVIPISEVIDAISQADSNLLTNYKVNVSP